MELLCPNDWVNPVYSSLLFHFPPATITTGGLLETLVNKEPHRNVTAPSMTELFIYPCDSSCFLKLPNPILITSSNK